MSNPLMGMMDGNGPAQNIMSQMIGMLKKCRKSGSDSPEYGSVRSGDKKGYGYVQRQEPSAGIHGAVPISGYQTSERYWKFEMILKQARSFDK